MDIKKALIFFLRQCMAAAGFLFLGFILLEWFMPGSVLPFIDVIDFIPLTAILFFFAFLTTERKAGKWNYLYIFIGILISSILLFVLWAKIDGYSLKNVVLVSSGVMCVIIWALIMRKEPVN
ncbi:hypothetical protein KKG46_00095 [Patescibacteria group bacterium]|nr:hypothetical protein [Patescibacteria group bacterium]